MCKCMDNKERLSITARKANKAVSMLIPATSQQDGLLTANLLNKINQIYVGREVVKEGQDVTQLGPGYYLAPSSLTGVPTAQQEPTPFAWFVDITISYNGAKVIVLTNLASSRMFKRIYPNASNNNNPTMWQHLVSETLLFSGSQPIGSGTTIQINDNSSYYEKVIISFLYGNHPYEFTTSYSSTQEANFQYISDEGSVIRFVKFLVNVSANSIAVSGQKIIKADLSNGTSAVGTDLSGVSITKVTGVK